MNSTPPIRQIHPLLSTKQSKNAQEKRRAAKRREQPRDTGTHDRAPPTTSHGGPTVSPRWALPGPIPIFLERRGLVYFWASGYSLDLPVLGLLDLLFNLSSLGLASTHLFLLKLGPNHANLQSQLNKAKSEHNQRNTCINRKLMQINPKFQA